MQQTPQVLGFKLIHWSFRFHFLWSRKRHAFLFCNDNIFKWSSVISEMSLPIMKSTTQILILQQIRIYWGSLKYRTDSHNCLVCSIISRDFWHEDEWSKIYKLKYSGSITGSLLRRAAGRIFQYQDLYTNVLYHCNEIWVHSFFMMIILLPYCLWLWLR